MKKITYLLLSCLFLLACEKQEAEPEMNYVVKFELENTALTGTEAEMRGKFIMLGTYNFKMEEFGAVLTEQESNASSTILLIDTLKVVGEEVFLLENLSIGKHYSLYLYTRAGEEEWKSEPLAFTTAQPEVNSISSLSAAPGDTVLIRGSNLPMNLEAVSVHFGELPAKVLRGGQDSLEVEVPAMDFEARSVTVSFDSYSHTFEEDFVRNPWKGYRVPIRGGESSGYSGTRPVFTIGNITYFTFLYSSYFSNSDPLWAFDINTKTFTKKNNLPKRGLVLEAAGLNGKGYGVFASSSDSEVNELMEYDPDSDTWQVAELLEAPARSYYSSLFERNGLLYLMGGYSSGSRQLTFTDFYSYDVENDVYETLPPVDFSISGPFFESRNILYAIQKEENKILAYNEGEGSWNELFVCPEEIQNPVFLPFNDKVYVFSFEQEKTWSYDLNNSVWKEEPAALAPPSDGIGSTGFTANGKGYLNIITHTKPPMLWEFSPE